jgi:hypothetical protein
VLRHPGAIDVVVLEALGNIAGTGGGDKYVWWLVGVSQQRMLQCVKG